MVLLVQGHWIVGYWSSCPPRLRNRSCLTIHDSDLAGSRQVEEDSRSILLELERLRMCVEFDVGEFRSFLIKFTQSASSVADPDVTTARIKAKVVGILSVRNRFQQLPASSVEGSD